MDLAIRFSPLRARDVATQVAERLAEMGQFASAGEALLGVDKVKEALDMFMAAESWDKARDVAKNIAPQ